MGTKRGKFTVLPGEGEKVPEIVSGLPPATRRTSGFRKKPDISECAEEVGAADESVDPAVAEAVEEGVFVTHRRLETLMEPAIAKFRLRAMGLDDQIAENSILNSETFATVIAEKVRCREAIMAALQRNFCYINNWWESKNPVERLWGQLNNAFLIVPRWQFVEDLKAVLGNEIEATKPAGYADENLVVVMLNKEALKQKVYAKLVMEGYPEGEHNRVYTDLELSAIIATKPKGEVDE